jgi:hypothetical protein
MGTKNNPGQFDCHAAAAPDEPIFTLLARDRHAPTLVRLWALLRHREGEDEEKVAEALECAAAMLAWRDTPRNGRVARHSTDDERLIIERLLVAATEGMDEHPDGFDDACDCNLCRSYA